MSILTRIGLPRIILAVGLAFTLLTEFSARENLYRGGLGDEAARELSQSGIRYTVLLASWAIVEAVLSLRPTKGSKEIGQ